MIARGWNENGPWLYARGGGLGLHLMLRRGVSFWFPGTRRTFPFNFSLQWGTGLSVLLMVMQGETWGRDTVLAGFVADLGRRPRLIFTRNLAGGESR